MKKVNIVPADAPAATADRASAGTILTSRSNFINTHGLNKLGNW